VAAEKILAIKFKYLGDVVVMVPALRALRAHFSAAELHVLVAAEAAPLLHGLDWIDRVWPLPRSRGKWRLRESLPLIRQLRAEHFDRSVDFVGNDRGAALSRLIGARQRLGACTQEGHRIRRRLYTQTVEELDFTRHETVRDYYTLTAWGVPPPEDWQPRLAPPASAATASAGRIVCHLSTSQRKKEWPLAHWQELATLLQESGHCLILSSGPSPREQALLDELTRAVPGLDRLPVAATLGSFMASLLGARLFVSPDTAPLHIAAGLGIPTLGLFGPTSPERWAPPGSGHDALRGSLCPCSGHLEKCTQADHCIDAIQPAAVATRIESLLALA